MKLKAAGEAKIYINGQEINTNLSDLNFEYKWKISMFDRIKLFIKWIFRKKKYSFSVKIKDFKGNLNGK